MKILKSTLSVIGWTLWFSLLAAIIPGTIWLFLGLLVDGTVWFMKLSWGIKIPVYLVVGFVWQYYLRSKNRIINQ